MTATPKRTRHLMELDGKQLLVFTWVGHAEPVIMAKGASRRWGMGNVTADQRRHVLEVLTK